MRGWKRNTPSAGRSTRRRKARAVNRDDIAAIDTLIDIGYPLFRYIQLRHLHCHAADPAYEQGVADALGVSLQETLGIA
jgi:hypothetical protein